MGWNTLNLITSIGSFVFAIGVLLLFVNVVRGLRSGARAGANPWDGPTLEWSVPSPPPAYNFAVIPTVTSLHPLWDARLSPSATASSLDRGMLLEQGKETIGTTSLDATPDMLLEMPGDTVAPFWVALGASGTFVGLLLKNWGLVSVGVVVTALAVLAWLWPRRALGEREVAS
jgi:cytochrome c oxidase subunit 1/cytochrome c oxidase subunit I+III